MTCEACDARRKFLAADPEMNRDEDTRCDAHQKLARLLAFARRVAADPCFDVTAGLDTSCTEIGLTLEGRCASCQARALLQELDS